MAEIFGRGWAEGVKRWGGVWGRGFDPPIKNWLLYGNATYLRTLNIVTPVLQAIPAKYPEKNWKLVAVKLICKRVDETGSALIRKPSVVDLNRFVCQRWLNKLVNWFVRRKTYQEQARAPERSLDNWIFIDRPFSELWNVIFNCLPFDVFQLRSSLTPSSRNVMNAVWNLSVACQ